MISRRDELERWELSRWSVENTKLHTDVISQRRAKGRTSAQVFYANVKCALIFLALPGLNVSAVIRAAGPIQIHTVHTCKGEKEDRGGQTRGGYRGQEGGKEARAGVPIKEWPGSTEIEVRREGGRETGGGRREAGRQRRGVMSPLTGSQWESGGVERESGRRRVCFSITAASAERRGAQSISQRRRRGRRKGTSR